MRIAVADVAEFIEALQDVSTIFDNTVRASIFKRPFEGQNSRTAAKFEVFFQVSCVVITEKDEEYLIETAEFCGNDYNDATPETDGTKKAEFLKHTLREFATNKGWKLLPGVILD